METTARSCLLALGLALVITSAACAKSAPADGSAAPGSAAVVPARSATEPAAASAATATAATATAATVAPPPTGSAIPPSVMRAVCSHEPCGDVGGANQDLIHRPVVRVYRDASGRVGRLYRIYGRCSHSPGVYFSPDGRESAVIPERPIAPGSADALAVKAQHDTQTAGLKLAEELRCADVVGAAR